jgi:imidazolonepropionase-like amidohydrolase
VIRSIRSIRTGVVVPFAVALAALAVAPARAFAQEGGDEKKDESADKKKDEPDRWFVVRNAEVHTGTGAVLGDAMILAKNGKIQAIGHDVDVPPDAKELDVHGLRVYPGLVAISSSGLIGSTTSDFADTVNPFSSNMVLGLATGITTTGSGNGAVKLKRFSLKDVVVRDKVFTVFTWSARNASSKRSMREKFTAAAAWLRDFREWEEKVKKDKDLKEPQKKGVDTSVLAVLRGESTAKFNANDRDDLLGIARFAQEFGFRPVIEGCVEGWTVADELGRAGAMAIVTPRDRRPKDEALVRPGGSSIENAAILFRSGVPVAVVPATESVDLGGIVGRDIMALPIEADFAIRGGLPEDAALASITTVPARILGIQHRVGSLEVGKDCDLIVTDGDLLHYETFVQWTVVDGKVVYDKEKELYFAHIRPRPVVAAEPKLDKGETKPTDEKAKEGEAKPSDEKHGDDAKNGDGEKPHDGEKKGG